MTTRPEAGELATQVYFRSKTWCNVWRIERRDGVVVRLTDHDCSVLFEGETYSPIGMGSWSAERREAGLKSGSVEAVGLIRDGVVTVADSMASAFRDAAVRHRWVDWLRPHRVHYRSTKWIAFMGHDGESWTATMEGRSQQFARPVGGRFGGVYKAQCNYRLGDSNCRASVVPVTGGYTGTCTLAQNDPTKLRDTWKWWGINELAGAHVYLTSGAGAGQERTVLSNVANEMTIKGAWDQGGNPTLTTAYIVGFGAAVLAVPTQRAVIDLDPADIPGSYADDWFRDGEAEFVGGANDSSVLPIQAYLHASRRITLLLPTPFNVSVGDRVIIRPGCDGNRGTCLGKFNNVARFGGSPYDPEAGEAIEPPSKDV